MAKSMPWYTHPPTPEKGKAGILWEFLHTCSQQHSSHSQKLEITQMFIIRGMDKEDVV